MQYVLPYFVNVVFTWVSLLVVIPIAQRLADFSLPPWGERMWKLAVVAAVACAVSLGVGMVNGWLGWIASGIVAFGLFRWWFDMDLFGAVIVVIVNAVVQMILGGLVLAALGSLLHRLGG